MFGEWRDEERNQEERETGLRFIKKREGWKGRVRGAVREDRYDPYVSVSLDLEVTTIGVGSTGSEMPYPINKSYSFINGI